MLIEFAAQCLHDPDQVDANVSQNESDEEPTEVVAHMGVLEETQVHNKDVGEEKNGRLVVKFEIIVFIALERLGFHHIEEVGKIGCDY